MMSSVVSSNPGVNSDRSLSSSSSSRRKKKNKIQQDAQVERNSAIEWKSESQQQIYSCNLVQALHHEVRVREARRVREAANRVLAASAKGRSRWSRAILSNRVKLKFMKKSSSMAQRQRKVMSVVHNKSKGSSCVSVRRKANVLARLVPGCRKQPLPVVLEEATDYIAALQMQVRAMSALAELLSVSSGATQ